MELGTVGAELFRHSCDRVRLSGAELCTVGAEQATVGAELRAGQSWTQLGRVTEVIKGFSSPPGQS